MLRYPFGDIEDGLLTCWSAELRVHENLSYCARMRAILFFAELSDLVWEKCLPGTFQNMSRSDDIVSFGTCSVW